MPTVIYFSPEHGKHANLIGKFDKDSLIEHETKFKEGKLPLQTVKVPLSDMKLSDITDCSADQLAVDEDESIDDILAEILAEEEAKKAEEKEESGYGGKKKKAKKGKKGKKKKGSDQRDEL